MDQQQAFALGGASSACSVIGGWARRTLSAWIAARACWSSCGIWAWRACRAWRCWLDVDTVALEEGGGPRWSVARSEYRRDRRPHSDADGRSGIEWYGDVLVRFRYFAMTPNRFLWRQDQSRDGGKTWILDTGMMEAKRIGK